MNPFYILIFGPPVVALLLLAGFLAWAAIAPGLAWQNVQDRQQKTRYL